MVAVLFAPVVCCFSPLVVVFASRCLLQFLLAAVSVVSVVSVVSAVSAASAVSVVPSVSV